MLSYVDWLLAANDRIPGPNRPRLTMIAIIVRTVDFDVRLFLVDVISNSMSDLELFLIQIVTCPLALSIIVRN